MELNVYHDRKLVEIWLTSAEQADEALQRRLKSLYKSYKSQKFLIAVLISGNASLEDCTIGLLRHNQTAAAQRDLKQSGEVVS